MYCTCMCHQVSSKFYWRRFRHLYNWTVTSTNHIKCTQLNPLITKFKYHNSHTPVAAKWGDQKRAFCINHEIRRGEKCYVLFSSLIVCFALVSHFPQNALFASRGGIIKLGQKSVLFSNEHTGNYWKSSILTNNLSLLVLETII